ncbi:hypothetical protein B7P43_G14793 [Cryptotermes secundus]|uniref:Uncharacterized protein n=1 Tax=Cryptotermes secundus TaxID=105785 RepID=A0A2J7PPM5_9NEOP|nr:hypothetical protein B7P43_G14793 [Cryptotermes secundus]
MEALFYCLQILAREHVHSSPCPQSMNDVSSATLMDGQLLAPELEITSTLRDSPEVASLIGFVQLELRNWDLMDKLSHNAAACMRTGESCY